MLTLKRFAVTAVLMASLAVPAAATAQGQDLRSPDRQFPAAPGVTQDLRNPDRQAPTAPATLQDLRNADQRAPVAGELPAVDAPPITAVELPAEGFDWGDAGIGAAGGVAVLAMLAGLGLAATHRRRGPRVPA